jgi:hypothetical protein
MLRQDKENTFKGIPGKENDEWLTPNQFHAKNAKENATQRARRK